MGTFIDGLKRHLSIYSHEGNAFDLKRDTMIKKPPVTRCWHKIVKGDRIALCKEAIYRLAPNTAPKSWKTAAKNVDRSVGAKSGDRSVETYSQRLFVKNKDKAADVAANIDSIKQLFSDLEAGIGAGDVTPTDKEAVPKAAKKVGSQRQRGAGWKPGGRPQTNYSPDEINKNASLPEGAKRRVTVNAYERNRQARERCIKNYKAECCICGFSFGDTYGDVAKGFIHVHHVKPLSEIGTGYKVDPIKDLRPVCPNCHAVIHIRQGESPFSIEEVTAFLRREESR